MNWRDRSSLDGYLWFGNWSGTQSGADAQGAGPVTTAVSAIIAYSPWLIEPDVAVWVKKLEMNLIDATGGHDAAPTVSVLIAQLRVIDIGRLQWICMTKDTPRASSDNHLYSLGRIWAKADESEDPVFFHSDLNPAYLTGNTPAGQPVLGAPTTQVNYYNQPLAIEWSRIYTNTGGAQANGWNCTWSVDFYRRDPDRYPQSQPKFLTAPSRRSN